MNGKTNAAIEKLEKSDLNVTAWKPLFKELIEKTGGGEKRGTIIIPFSISIEFDGRKLIGFFQHYLKKFGMKTHLSYDLEFLTYYPEQIK